MQVLVAVYLGIVGAIFGSYACATAYRIAGKVGSGSSASEKAKRRRSHCLSCGYMLQWYDLIPIISWATLRGRCRKCKKRIGWLEVLMEFGLGAIFAISYLFWPDGEIWGTCGLDGALGLAKLVTWLMLLVSLAISFVTDHKWGQLSTKVLVFSVLCSILFLTLDLAPANFAIAKNSSMWIGLLGSLAVLPGLYLVLYKFSKERWVGGGDYLLCLPFALVLHDLWLACLVLFLANALALFSFLIIRNKRIHFAPFLIIAFLAVFFIKDLALRFLMM